MVNRANLIKNINWTSKIFMFVS